MSRWRDSDLVERDWSDVGDDWLTMFLRWLALFVWTMFGLAGIGLVVVLIAVVVMAR